MALSTLYEGYRWDGVAAVGVALVAFGTWLALRPQAKAALAKDVTPA
jgi:hypothetical protein